MIIVSYGMVKSASTFAYQVLREALLAHCVATGDSYIALSELDVDAGSDYVGGSADISGIYQNILSSGFDFSSRDHLLIKTHLPASRFASFFNLKGFVSVASYRHPIEVALSLVDAAQRDSSRGLNRFTKYENLEDALHEVPYQVECLLSWLNSCHSFPLYYDDLANDPLAIFKKLFSELELQVDVTDILNTFQDKSATVAEFNKGVAGRRFSDADPALLEEVEKQYPEIIALIENRQA